MPTIRQLAAHSGYSIATISMALRGHPSIPEHTRKTISKLAIDQGYTPDPLVASLMTQLRTRRNERPREKLAYLTTWPSRDKWKTVRNEVLWFKGACERAESQGYEIEVFRAKEPGITGQRLSEILYTRGIHGVILAPLVRPRGHVSLDWKRFAAAAISFTITKPDLHRTTHFHSSGMRMALRKLRVLGYRRIGFLMLQSQVDRVGDGWLAPFVLHQHNLSSDCRVPPLIQAEWNLPEIKAWMETHRVDAVLSNMLEPLDFLAKMGRRVPEEIGYVSLDCAHDQPTYACIDQLPKTVGAAAVDLVIGQLRRNEYGLPEHPQTLALEGIWRDGGTVRPLRRVKLAA